MRTLFIVGVLEDGSAVLIAFGGGQAIPSVQIKFNDLRVSGALPKGVVRAELHDSERGRVGIAVPKPQTIKGKEATK